MSQDGHVPELQDVILVAARVLSGLLAGLYLGFVVAVMPGLARLDDAGFADAMNRINEAILNPAFLLLFLGTPIVCCALLVWDRSPAVWVAVATAVLAVVITAAFNVPLNDALAADGVRSAFERPWNTWHVIRTAVCVTTFVATLLVSTA